MLLYVLDIGLTRELIEGYLTGRERASVAVSSKVLKTIFISDCTTLKLKIPSFVGPREYAAFARIAGMVQKLTAIHLIGSMADIISPPWPHTISVNGYSVFGTDTEQLVFDENDEEYMSSYNFVLATILGTLFPRRGTSKLLCLVLEDILSYDLSLILSDHHLQDLNRLEVIGDSRIMDFGAVELAPKLQILKFKSPEPEYRYWGVSRQLQKLGLDVGFPSLVHLELEVNRRFNSIESLEETKTLQHLEIPYANIDDVAALSNCTSLRTLRLPFSKLNSLDDLNECTCLEHVDISSCHLITSIDGIGSPALKVLNMKSTSVESLQPLAECTKLEELYLSYHRGMPVSLLPLRFCPSLKILSLRRRDILNPMELGSLSQNLVSLDLRLTKDMNNAYIDDVSWLARLPGLEELNLDYQQMSDVSALQHCQSLRKLSMAECEQLESIECLENCEMLTELVITNCLNLQSINGLGCCDKLEVLEANYCRKLRTIHHLATCVELRVVRLSHCTQIRYLTALGNCPHLEVVELFGFMSLPDASSVPVDVLRLDENAYAT